MHDTWCFIMPTFGPMESINILSHCIHLHLGQTLEKLDIGPLPEQSTGGLGSLCTLTRLKHLTLLWDTVVETPEGDPSDEFAEGDALMLPQGVSRLVDLLPDSLEHLHIYLDQVTVEKWQLL